MEVRRFDEIYPDIQEGSFLKGEIPSSLINEFTLASEKNFIPTK